MKTGFFITFEGCEGSGKTTQTKKLFSYFKELNYSCILTCEPGGTVISNDIRKILLEKKNTSMFPITELFLYLASRSQHTEEIIRPALEKGEIVISDRFTDSSLAYQGAARNLSVDLVQKLNAIATGGIFPDITFLIDLEPKIGLERLKGKDRIENEEIKFHQRVRKAYLSIAESEKPRIKVLDGSTPEEVIFKNIIDTVQAHPWFYNRMVREPERT
jgi:dTMP kinase